MGLPEPSCGRNPHSPSRAGLSSRAFNSVGPNNEANTRIRPRNLFFVSMATLSVGPVSRFSNTQYHNCPSREILGDSVDRGQESCLVPYGVFLLLEGTDVGVPGSPSFFQTFRTSYSGMSRYSFCLQASKLETDDRKKRKNSENAAKNSEKMGLFPRQDLSDETSR